MGLTKYRKVYVEIISPNGEVGDKSFFASKIKDDKVQQVTQNAHIAEFDGIELELQISQSN